MPAQPQRSAIDAPSIDPRLQELREQLDDAEAHLMMANAIDDDRRHEREAAPWRARVRELRNQIRDLEGAQ